VCPHLGCGIDFSSRSNRFQCPCHESAFEVAAGQVAAGRLARHGSPRSAAWSKAASRSAISNSRPEPRTRSQCERNREAAGRGRRAGRYKKLMHEALDEALPGGASFRVRLRQRDPHPLSRADGHWPGTRHLLQSVVDGRVGLDRLPSSERSDGGDRPRMHHHTASGMVAMVGFHMLQVVFYGAYKAPREANWIAGLGLLGLTLGFALTATSCRGTRPAIGRPKSQPASRAHCPSLAKTFSTSPGRKRLRQPDPDEVLRAPRDPAAAADLRVDRRAPGAFPEARRHAERPG